MLSSWKLRLLLTIGTFIVSSSLFAAADSKKIGNFLLSIESEKIVIKNTDGRQEMIRFLEIGRDGTVRDDFANVPRNYENTLQFMRDFQHTEAPTFEFPMTIRLHGNTVAIYRGARYQNGWLHYTYSYEVNLVTALNGGNVRMTGSTSLTNGRSTVRNPEQYFSIDADFNISPFFTEAQGNMLSMTLVALPLTFSLNSRFN